MFVVEQEAAFVTLNAIWNQDESINSGFAVDAFQLHEKECYGGVVIDIAMAVRDSHAWLYRIGYTVTLVGHFAKSDMPVPG